MTQRVEAIMTAPRYEPVLSRNYIEMSVKQLHIPLMISGGVFYGQCMQTMLADLLRRNVELALTIDFDSMFTAGHIERLVDIMDADASIDAVAGIQAKRGCGSILAAVDGETSQQWDGKPVRVASAHFGLTLIRVEKLRTLPKPWFFAQPNADGDWTGEKIDDDVWFWRQWAAAGNTVYVDPGCRVGHLEEMVTVFNERMQLQHQYPRDWARDRHKTVDIEPEAVTQ